MERELTETIIYGGAFNPPTLAHQAILQACIDYAESRDADVWLLPSGNRLDKQIDVSRQRRLELCSALLDDVMSRTVGLAVNTTELDRPAPTQTYETVRELKEAYPERHFKWVFGSDSIASMPTWDNGEWLTDNLPILAIDRPGSPAVELGILAEWLRVEVPVISSTEVRGRMKKGEEYASLVGAHVRDVLEAENIYQ